eukprot:scaffold7211_cov83-Skeletonema_dohrnii-CCMP3373.AAC.2
MLNSYHGQPTWVTISSGSPHSQREIRYGAREYCWIAGVSDASSGHLRCCSDADTTNKCLSREKDASILSWPTIMGH